MMKSAKGRVACTPFPDMAVKTAVLGQGTVKVARIENKVSLVAMKVVMPTEDFRFVEGDVAYVRGNHYTQVWAKEIFQTPSGTDYILVPENLIEVFDREISIGG